MNFWAAKVVMVVSLGVVGGKRRGQNGRKLTDDAADSGCYLVDEFLVRRVFGFDEGGCAFDDCVYGFETGCFHRLSGF